MFRHLSRFVPVIFTACCMKWSVLTTACLALRARAAPARHAKRRFVPGYGRCTVKWHATCRAGAARSGCDTAGIAMALMPAVFLNTDGTLIEDVPFNVDPERIVLARGAIEGLARL